MFQHTIYHTNRRAFERELVKRSLKITPVLEIGRIGIITPVLSDNDMISYLPNFVTKDMAAAGKLCHLDVSNMKTDI